MRGTPRHYRNPRLSIGGREFPWGKRTYLMGIINVTPDSFSGDGTGGDVGLAVAQAVAMEHDGADFIDIGAESTRPDAEPVDAAEELRRLLPSLEAVRRAVSIPLSVDTYRAEVAAAAIQAGADMLNDVWGLRQDPAMADAVARAGIPVVIMHNQRGRGFHDVAGDITCGFEASLSIAESAGIDPANIILDPGFGFGWTPPRNLEMIRRLPELHRFGLPLLVGVSRKSTIGAVTGKPVDRRFPGSAAAVALAIAGGADIVRVHDTAAMRDVVAVADAITRGGWSADA